MYSIIMTVLHFRHISAVVASGRDETHLTNEKSVLSIRKANPRMDWNNPFRIHSKLESAGTTGHCMIMEFGVGMLSLALMMVSRQTALFAMRVCHNLKRIV